MRFSCKTFGLAVVFACVMLLPKPGAAAGWCNLAAGTYTVVSHGTKSASTYLFGPFEGTSTSVWIPIANATYGDSSVAIALAAQLADKRLSVYLDSANDTCANYPSWSGVIRHVKIIG